jgi:tetratricopeptide (TPR) repeat protein
MASDVSSARELIEKGNNANERSEFKKAIEFYEQALALARESEDRGGESLALGRLGNPHYSLGELNVAINYYKEALDIARDIDDKTNEWKWINNLGAAYSNKGEIRKAIEYYKQALTIARKIKDRRGEGFAFGNLGNAYSTLGEVGKAIKCYEKAFDIARDIEDNYLIYKGELVNNFGTAYSNLGEIRKAIKYYKQALTIARKNEYRQLEGTTLGNLGDAYSALGERKNAIEYYEQALAISREIGGREGEGVSLLNLGEANMVFGDWDKSLQLFNDALKIFETMGNLTGQGEVLLNIGELQIKSGEWEDARKNLEKSLERYEGTTPVGAIDVLVNLGELDSVEDRYEAAFSKFQKALTIASELELSPKKVNIFNKIGRAYLMEFEFNKSQESLDQAKNQCKSALKLANDLQRPLDQGISLRNLGIIYSKYNKINNSKNYFTQSLEIFQTLGARYELARTYLELAKMLAENNELLEAEEKTKVCAFDAIHRNFKELEVCTYMLLGDIVWKQDNSQYGYYLTALKTAIFNPKIYTRTIFLLIDRMKRMEKDTYLFSWDNVPGNDSGRLLRYLMSDHDIGWAENVEIQKSDDCKTIRISKNENSAEIMINEKEEKATLTISDGRTHNLKVKRENNKLNMYKDTTIEFIDALKEVNIEIHFDTFLNALASKIQGGEGNRIEGLPEELEEEFNKFPIASK